MFPVIPVVTLPVDLKEGCLRLLQSSGSVFISNRREQNPSHEDSPFSARILPNPACCCGVVPFLHPPYISTSRLFRHLVALDTEVSLVDSTTLVSTLYIFKPPFTHYHHNGSLRLLQREQQQPHLSAQYSPHRLHISTSLLLSRLPRPGDPNHSYRQHDLLSHIQHPLLQPR